jgi:hypothetical protein
LLIDFDHWGCFRLLGKLVDGNIEESAPSDGAWERPHDVQPPHSEGPCGRDHLHRLCQHVDLLGMELTRLTGLYQLDDVLESYRPLKSVPKGFTNQRAERCMVPTLTSMNFCEQLTALLLGNAPH